MQYMQSMKVWVVAAVCCGALAARAAEIDQSTPKATALSFAKALEAGDADAAKKLSVGTDQDQQVLSAMLEFTRSIKQLRESAVKKYADKADEVTGGGMNMDSTKALEDSEIKETGDTATVIATKPQPSTMHLKKIDGKWMVNLTDTLKEATGPGQDVTQFQAMLKSWSSAITETAGEIDDGKYPRPRMQDGALQVKMMAALKALSPTTAPQPRLRGSEKCCVLGAEISILSTQDSALGTRHSALLLLLPRRRQAII